MGPTKIHIALLQGHLADPLAQSMKAIPETFGLMSNQRHLHFLMEQKQHQEGACLVEALATPKTHAPKGAIGAIGAISEPFARKKKERVNSESKSDCEFSVLVAEQTREWTP